MISSPVGCPVLLLSLPAYLSFYPYLNFTLQIISVRRATMSQCTAIRPFYRRSGTKKVCKARQDGRAHSDLYEPRTREASMIEHEVKGKKYDSELCTFRVLQKRTPWIHPPHFPSLF